jgi:hypothetical protein
VGYLTCEDLREVHGGEGIREGMVGEQAHLHMRPLSPLPPLRAHMPPCYVRTPLPINVHQYDVTRDQCSDRAGTERDARRAGVSSLRHALVLLYCGR